MTSFSTGDDVFSPLTNDVYSAARGLATRMRGADPTMPRPRTRVGAVLLASRHLGQEPQIAVHLRAHTVSLAERVLDSVPAGSAWVPLDAMTLLRHLDTLADAPFSQGGGDCWLVTHLDLVLAKVNAAERQTFWREARTNLPGRARALLLAVPREAKVLPEEKEWSLWQESDRVATIG